MTVVGAVQLGGVKPVRSDLSVGEMEVVEAVVMRCSTIDNNTARRLNLRELFGINMIAIAREGVAVLDKKLKDIRFHAGDVLLLQMPTVNMRETLSRLGLLPLARRDLPVARVQRLVAATAIFGLAIAATALNYYPSAVSFSVAAAAMILFRVISIRQAHEAIDWSVVLLLGAMIPVGDAFETTGAVSQMTGWIGTIDFLQSPVTMLTVVLVMTMCLSDVLNNAATAIVMAPFAAAIAKSLGVAADPFLMAVAIGASCAFLTPVGHQSNTLVMGPGGYRFGDYFRMGFLLEIIVACLTVPILWWYWGLAPVAD
jgi:di/tricarboxylate transporter